VQLIKRLVVVVMVVVARKVINVTQADKYFKVTVHSFNNDPHMPAGKVWIYVSFTVCLFVCLFVCTVMYFFAEDKASGVTFCSAVHRRPRQGITNFCELCFPKSPKSDELASARATPPACKHYRRDAPT